MSTRRSVRYRTFDELLDDARRAATTPTQLLGKWSLGQIFWHIAAANRGAIDGFGYVAPWFVRWPARWLLKPYLLRWPSPPGKPITPRFRRLLEPASDVTTDEALHDLIASVQRLRTESHRGIHPLLGRMTVAEWDRFQLRHAELHMSHVVYQ